MKLLVVALLLGVTTFILSGQSPSNPQDPSITVLKFSWGKERIGWERDPFSGPIEDFDEVRARVRNEKRIDDAKRGGNSVVADKISREARADEANMAQKHKNTPSRYVFVYKVTVKNSSDKPIKSLDWDHIFLDAQTQTELNRQQFTSEEKIGAGKTRELKVVVNKPPTATISADALDKNERDGLSERVVIIRIQYADGSTWQHP
jgi:hypothetical protein